MSRWYVDTSAALKLLVEEAESVALAELIDATEPDLVSCWLLDTELRRVVHRHDALTHADVSDLLDGIDLYDVPPSMFREAGLLPGPRLRSLDALHLAAAVHIGVEQILTYDLRMAESAHSLGITVASPC